MMATVQIAAYASFSSTDYTMDDIPPARSLHRLPVLEIVNESSMLASSKSAEQRVFEQLKRILYRWAPALHEVCNEPDRYLLNTHHIMKNKKPLFFGSVQIKKTYVSFYLMPVYVNPDLLEDLTPELRKRMQGKSCFNFKEPDARLFAELKTLVRSGYEDYVRQGFIVAPGS